jgi:predicted nucleic acid-binding protein
MIAVDTNLLVYAHREDSEWHVPALSVVEGLAAGAAPWAVPWPCLHHGVRTLLSADRDFGRFPELRTENPLVG